jgi:electron transport complex protein RnfD
MTSWPKPSAITEKLLPYMDVTTGATPLGIVKEAIRNGVKISEIQGLPDQLQMFLGNMSGSLGEISAIALLIGFAYMLFRKIITWHIPVSIIVTIAIFTEILSLGNPERFTGPIFNILTGGVLLGAIFMATDYVTSPMSKRGMIIYGIGIGMLTVIIRAFGAFPEGVSFAILIMNGLTPMINTYLKPKRFGEKQKI